MKIIVVSDTHRNFNVLDDIVKSNNDADMLIHLGDGENEFDDISRLYPQFPMVYVGGNCDYDTHKLSHVVTAGGLKIFCCHGHTYRVHDGVEYLVGAAYMNSCSVALYGHTHLHFTKQVGGVFVMNPGSPGEPRGGNQPTYGILEIVGSGEVKMSIINAKDNKPI